jgi:hypothetical protein
MTDKQSIKSLRDHLTSKEKYEKVLTFFINKTIEEQKDTLDKKKYKSEKERLGGQMFLEFYSTFMNSYPKQNAEIVFKTCKSPIEQIFVNSLQLLFLKNGNMGLHLTPPFKNSTLEMANFRTAHNNILSLANQYVEMTGDSEMNDFEEFFDKQIKTGKFTKDDYHTFEYHRIIVKNFIWNAYHLTPQARFPEFKINKGGIRVDLLLWCPGDENLKLIIECDGFQYHNSKTTFESDRKRDRLLKMNGYQVIRFSGAEIHKDPISVSSELFDFIQTLDKPTKNKSPKKRASKKTSA